MVAKYYPRLLKLGVFALHDVYALTANLPSAKSLVGRYLRYGLIARVKKNLYTSLNLETSKSSPTFYHIASQVSSSAFISHLTAFSFYGLYKGPLPIVHVSSLTQFRDINFEDRKYLFIGTKTEQQVEKIGEVRVTSIERTIVDSVKCLSHYITFPQLIECLNAFDTLHQELDEQKIWSYLTELDNLLLFKKVGYVLSYYPQFLAHPEDFLRKLKQAGNTVGGYFVNLERGAQVFEKWWHLYVLPLEKVNNRVQVVAK
jgi:predicted transcriptional regulator of viral defense system